MNSQERILVEKRAAAYSHAKDLLERAAAESRGLTSEEETTVDNAFADVDKYDADLQRYRRAADLDTRFEVIDEAAAEQRTRVMVDAGVSTSVEESRDALRDHTEAFWTFAARGVAALNGEQRAALERFDQEQRAMGVITGVGGGYAAPDGFWSKVTETMKFYGGMMQVGVEAINTPNGNPLPWPTNDDTSNTGSWVAENTDAGTATDLSFGAKTLYAHGLSSSILKVSLAYLQDVDPVAGEAFITRKLGERMGRTLNTALTTGNGVNKPYGIINGLSTGKTTASPTAITAPEIIDLQHSVDVAYRTNARFMLHDLILAAIRKLVDTTGQPIFQVDFRSGTPATLLGNQFVLNNDMDSAVTTGKKTIAFGDFQACYAMRTVTGGQLRRLEERYAEFGQVGFISFGRYDGLVQDASAVKLLVQA